MKARTSVAFFPHGLGHYLGMDTHDVGGNPNPEDEDKLFRYLRLRGRVPAGSVVTVEPGVSSSFPHVPFVRWIWPLQRQGWNGTGANCHRSTSASSSSSRTSRTPRTPSSSTCLCWTSTGTSAASGEFSSLIPCACVCVMWLTGAGSRITSSSRRRGARTSRTRPRTPRSSSGSSRGSRQPAPGVGVSCRPEGLDVTECMDG